MITRHDIPQEVKEVIQVAVTEEVIDLSELYSLATTHKDDWRGLVNDIVEMAFSWIHSDKTKHTAVVQVADKYWAKVTKEFLDKNFNQAIGNE